MRISENASRHGDCFARQCLGIVETTRVDEHTSIHRLCEWSTHGCSVVNAGIAAGDGSGVRHASNYLGLVARYVTLVIANAWRTRGPLRILSLLCVVGAAWTASSAARTKHGDDCPLAQ